MSGLSNAQKIADLRAQQARAWRAGDDMDEAFIQRQIDDLIAQTLSARAISSRFSQRAAT